MRRPAVRKRPAPKSADAALSARLGGALPVPAAKSSERVARWIASLARSAAGRTLKERINRNQALAATVAGIAETAPYLWDLISTDPARFARFTDNDPDKEFSLLLSEARRLSVMADSPAEVMSILRRMKADAALLIALADIGGVWPVARVTKALTDVAETALNAAIHHLLGQAASRGKLILSDPAHPEAGSGYIVIAMGKMGAYELNYSSDIDLMVFFDAAAAKLARNVEPQSFYVHLTRDLVKLLQERTSDGYVFRVDLRLRPDPSSTQIAMSSAAALEYYEHRGQNWERAALIKARACAGDIAAGEKLLHDLSPFVWRRYLDYAAIADVHAMKQQIHAYRGHGAIAVEGHNIKLGRGGIREIEFFAQTQQLIAGGRHRELRGRETVATLKALADGGWIDTTARDELAAAYDFLRRVEHRLQMMNDEQTHTLPSDPNALGEFARFLGFKGRDEFAKVLLAHLHNVEKHYVRLFERAPAVPGERRLSLAAEEGAATLDRLSEMGFRQPQSVVAAVRAWQAGEYRALRGEQARDNLIALAPLIVDQLSRAENPDAAFAAFDRFVAGLRGGGRFLSLLRQNPELIRFIGLMLSVAPRLADILAQHPHVIDPLIDPSFFGSLPDEQQLEAGLRRALSDTESYEEVLDAIRLFGQEHMFLIGARILSGSVSAERAGELFARLADVLIRAVHRAVETNFASLHGRIRGQETAIIALGRLGAREMTANSDLDLIVVYDFDAAHPNSNGKRPLYGAQYFARLTQRLVSALTVQTNYGVLYHVDMRLRPSGRSGPLATQIDGFAAYQEREAWTWEHMALTRARVVSGPASFAAKVEATMRAALCRTRDSAKIAADVIEMRGRIATEKGSAGPWDLKYAPGALVDIEFIAQYLQLVHAAAMPDIIDTSTARSLEKAARLGVLAAEDAEVLRPAVRLFHDLTQILRLCLPGPFDPKTAGAGVLALLARAADLPDFAALQAHVEDTEREVRECFVRILGKAP
jgi:[glutamine synthetase] adenylyltransferase / [glutamine synthetase]-adenylyl-L-tyrosine phosphorylase